MHVMSPPSVGQSGQRGQSFEGHRDREGPSLASVARTLPDHAAGLGDSVRVADLCLILGREMPPPIIFKTTHRVRFSDLDLYNHMSTARYAAYYVDHRMEGLRDELGWNLKALGALPFMVVVRRLEVDFIRPALGDQEITIRSFVRDFHGPDAIIECAMVAAAGKEVSRCLMTVAYVDRETNRTADWPERVAALFFEKETG